MAKPLSARQATGTVALGTPTLQVKVLGAHIRAIEQIRVTLQTKVLRVVSRSDVVRVAIESLYGEMFRPKSFDDLLEGQPPLPPPAAFPGRGEAGLVELPGNPSPETYTLVCPVCGEPRESLVPPKEGEDLTCLRCFGNGLRKCDRCGRNFFHGKDAAEPHNGLCEDCRHPRSRKPRARRRK